MQNNPFVLTRDGRAERISYLQNLLDNPPDPAYCMDDVGCGEGHTEEDHDRLELELQLKVLEDPEVLAELDAYFEGGGQPYDPNAPEEDDDIPPAAALMLAMMLAGTFNEDDEETSPGDVAKKPQSAHYSGESPSTPAVMFAMLPEEMREDIIARLESDIAQPWSEELDTPKRCCGRTGRQHLSDRLEELQAIHARLQNGESAFDMMNTISSQGHIELGLTPFGAIIMDASEGVPPEVFAVLEDMFGPIVSNPSEAPGFASFNMN